VDLAECIVTLGREPKKQLEIFTEISELILGYELFRLIMLLLMSSQSCVRNYRSAKKPSLFSRSEGGLGKLVTD
jgi:hypothetical protein